jgi:uroporphyrinogen-III synthase
VIRSILITKSKDDKGALYDYCISQNIDIHYHSFLTFKQIELPEIPTTDVLFFSSKRAVDYFLNQSKIPTKTAIACIGESTKKHLESSGFKVDFVGENAGKPKEISRKLKEWLGASSITIVLAKESKQSILTHLDPIKSKMAVVYDSVISAQKIDQNFDCYVFTSPSNVAGFLGENILPANAKVIAWGETTKEYLEAKQIDVTKTLETSSENEVVQILTTEEN